MPSITFYGGVGELGGTKLLLEDKGTKILVDFGINFDRMAKYYGFPYFPKHHKELDTIIKLNFYPNIEGLYRYDITDDRSPPAVDGVLLSHAHLDHADGIHYIRPDIPVYTDPSTRRILHVMEHTGGAYRHDFLTFRNMAWVEKAREDGLVRKHISSPRAWKVFHPPEPFDIGNIHIEPYYIDHSLPGACAFIIYTSAGTVVYTGDLRLRGRRREDTEAFVRAAAAANPKYLLCEGSLIDKKHVSSEDGVVDAIYHFSKDKKIVFAAWPPRDIDRIVSFYKAARKLKRKLVLDPKQAFLLDDFNGQLGYPTSKSSVIRVYLTRKGAGLIDTDFPESEWGKDYYAWQKIYIKHKNRVTLEELKKNPENYIMFLSGAVLEGLTELEPPKGSAYIRSHPEPYTPEMELDEERMLNWLHKYDLISPKVPDELFSLGSSEIPQAHITGHMSYDETAWLVNAIKPETLIPIHTLFPDWFTRFYPVDKVHLVKHEERVEF